MNSKQINILASLGLILTAAIWGFAFVVVKDSLDFVPPIYMTAIRFAIAGIVLALILNRHLAVINRKYILHGIFTGFLLGMGYITQTIGCNFTTAGKNAFLTTIYVILIPLFSWPLNKKRPGIIVFLSAIMALTGIGLLALRHETGGGFSMNFGDVMTLICGVFYALHIIFTARLGKDKNMLVFTALQFLTASLLAWLCAPVFDGALPFRDLAQSKVVVSMLYLGIFSSLVAFCLQNICLKYMESSLASLFLSLESVFGVLFSAIFLKERMSAVMIIGCILIFAAITIADQFKPKEN